jgi:hypothetical protein
MKLHLRSPLAAVLILLTSTALPAEAPIEPERQPVVGEGVEDITVTAQRREALRMRMQEFITEIGDPVSRHQGYARWRRDVCVGVSGLADPVPAQYIADRISFRALENGLRPKGPGCRPNIQVIFTADGRGTATRLVADSPRAFRPFGGESGTTQGLQALGEFQTAEVAVRWWQIMAPVDDHGQPAIDMTGGVGGTPNIRGSNSRIKNSISEALWSSVVIIDTTRLGEVDWPQLGDYVTMVALAQVKPDGEPADYDSILNLFRTENPPPAMTDMDLAYLKALYEMDISLMPRVQRRVFATEMLHESEE